MARLQHPAYVLGTGQPGSVPLAPVSNRQQADVDEDGYFEVVDEDAPAVRDRLAGVYDVEYEDGDVVVPDDHPTVSDETSGDATPETESSDVDEGTDEEASGTYSRDELEEMEHEARKDVYRDLGGDTDAIDMRKSGEVVAGILRLQAENGGE